MPNEIKPEQVPKEVLAAFRKSAGNPLSSIAEDLATALNAWPGMRVQEPHSLTWFPTVIILPLTEKPDV